MAKILVLFTGGTIGSTVDNGTINVSKDRVLIKKYYEKTGDVSTSFEEHDIADVLSENMTISIWERIANGIKAYDRTKYDGIIITHGTDTLAYTANYLSMILANVEVPVAIVSSNYVLSDPRANGLKNFIGAVDLIKDFSSIPGIYVVYNDGLDTKVIYGSRVTQCQPIMDDFNSVNHKMLGRMIDGHFLTSDYDLVNSIKNRSNDSKTNLIDSLRNLRNAVQIIFPYVGLNYNTFNMDEPTQAFLHTLYHSGTACADGKVSETLTDFIKRCKSKGKDVFVGPIYGEDTRDLYASTSKILDNGGHVIMNTSIENAYVKLMLAYSLFDSKKEREAFVLEDQNFEYIYKSNSLAK